MQKITLIVDATAELNCRTHGRDARLRRLAAGGAPLDRAALRVWLDAALDAELEAAGGLYLCADCWTARVPLRAELVGPTHYLRKATIYGPALKDTVRWLVGKRYPVNAEDASTAAEAEAVVRARLLKNGSWASTRREAVLLVTAMLERRTAVHS